MMTDEITTEIEDERTGIDGFCIVDLLGHKRMAGLVRVTDIGGTSFLRIDIPDVMLHGDHYEPLGTIVTRWVNPSAIYEIVACGEQEAYAVAHQSVAHPVQSWDVRALLPEIKEQVKRDIRDEYLAELREKGVQPQTPTYRLDDDLGEEPF